MLNKLSSATVVLLLAGGLTACSKAVEDTSNETLQKVVDGFLHEKSVCMPLALTDANAELSAGVQGMLGEPIIKLALTDDGEHENKAAQRQMKVLVDAGIYDYFVEDVLIKAEEQGGVVPAQVYQLTDKGREYVYDSRFGDIFCMGYERVKRIMVREDAKDKTPKGRYLVHISYEPEFVLEPWAKALADAGNKQLAKQISLGQISRTTLVYADGVWQDSRQYYKLNK